MNASTTFVESTVAAGRWKRRIIALTGIVAILFVAWLWITHLFTSRWEGYAAALRADGAPLTLEEIEASRSRLPEDQNGAIIVQGLFERLESLKREAGASVLVLGAEQPVVDFLAGLPTASIQPTREFREAHRDLLDVLRKLRDRPTGRFHLERGRTAIESLLPEMGPVRNASKLLHLDGLMRLVDGDMPGASENIIVSLHLAGTLDEHPTLIGRLVQMAVENQAARLLEASLAAGQFDDATLVDLSHEWDRRIRTATLQWALWGERAIFVETCDDLIAGRLQYPNLTEKPSFPFIPDALLRVNQLRGTDLWTKYMADLRTTSRPMEVTAGFEQTIQQLPKTQLVARALLPSIGRAITLHLRIEAELKSARCALAAERFRLAQGRFPNTLGELTPTFLDAVPRDPFIDAELRLAVNDQGITIYSVNNNAIDDGGSLAPVKTRGRDTLDIGFRLRLPSERTLVFLPAEEQ